MSGMMMSSGAMQQSAASASSAIPSSMQQQLQQQAVAAPSRKRMQEESSQRDDDASSESSSKRRNVEGRAVGTQAHPPSIVLHVRSLPTFTTEAELIAVLQPYGAVERAFITQHNHQAFCQMVSMEAAESVVAHSASPPGFSLRGRQIFLQYSNRREVVPPPNQNVSMQPRDSQSGYSAPGHHQHHDGGAPNSVLLISVTNLRVPVTLEHIHQICKPSGPVWKIVTFMKGPVFKALVQFGSIEAASHAKASLEGKDIFQGCCHVSVGFSSQSELKITSTGPKARDFQAEAIAAGGVGLGGGEMHNGGGASANSSAAGAAFNQLQQQQQQHQQQQQQQQQHSQQQPQQPQQQQQQQQQQQSGFPQMMGSQMGFGGYPPMQQMNPYAMQMAAAANPYAHIQAAQMGFVPYGQMQSVHSASSSSNNASGSGSYSSNSGNGVNTQGGPGSVLIVSGLPLIPEITPESLFVLFGCYGDVVRVKILFNKRDTAMVQFTSSAGCLLAIQYLHHTPLFEKQLNVSQSRNESISMPKSTNPMDAANPMNPSSQDEANALTQDFSQSKFHRFRTKPVNTKNLHAPSQVLHVGNIADGTSEEELRAVFGPHSIPQFFVRDTHMAYVKLPSISDSVLTLMRTHNYRLNGRSLRVSFSGKTVEQFDSQNMHPQGLPTLTGVGSVVGGGLGAASSSSSAMAYQQDDGGYQMGMDTHHPDDQDTL